MAAPYPQYSAYHEIFMKAIGYTTCSRPLGSRMVLMAWSHRPAPHPYPAPSLAADLTPLLGVFFLYNYSVLCQLNRGTPTMYTNASGEPNIPKIVTHAVIALVALVILFGSFGVVGSQERGVKVSLGVVKGILNPGLYFKFPLIDHVVKMDVKTQSLIATKDAPLSAASNDLQDTKLAVVVNYHITPTLVADIYQQYGSADTYYNTVVDPLIVATIKATAAQYTASDQIQKRAEMSAATLTALQAAFEGKNVTIEKADITDVAFSDSFTQSIERKVQAIQDAEAAQNKLVQVQAEAAQTLAQAQADAQAIKIKAEAINSTGGADYVALQAVEKWDGHLPTQYIPGGANPFIGTLK